MRSAPAGPSIPRVTARASTAYNPHFLYILAAVALAYFVAAKFGLALAFSTKQVTALWPPTGIAVASLLLGGYRLWPAIYLGAFAVNALVGDSILGAGAIAVGNTLGPVAVRFLLERFGAFFDPGLNRVRDVLQLIVFGAIVGAAVSATNGVAALVLGGVIPWSAYGSVWWVWWVGDAMGILVFAPLILSWAAQPRPNWHGARLVELGALFFGLLLASLVALGGVFVQPPTPSPFQLQFAVFPFIIWVGLRYGARETGLAAALVTGLAVWGAVHGRGPFAIGNLDHRLILLEIFMAVVTVTGLVLSAMSAERAEAQRALQRANDELGKRVAARTAELASANAILGRKNEEVEAFVYIVSHDLRAPLVNLQGFSSELQRSCDAIEAALVSADIPPSTQKAVQSILREDVAGALRYISASTGKFQRLIDALFLLSKTGKQELQIEIVDVHSVVETTILSLRQSIESSGAEVVMERMPEVTGDVTAIGQVFSNLISNALKYLQPGRPGRIVIGGERTGDTAHYWIRDNGSGISTSAQRRLFYVFQRFHPHLAPGEGMGLAIVKRIIERQGGSVWAESEEGVGTTFHLSLSAPIGMRRE
jgi:signal transduction histidine kinase